MKSKLVILDANVVITLHMMGLWEHIVQHYAVYVPSVVLHDEAFYFKSSGGDVPIDLAPFLVSKRVFEISASDADLLALQQKAPKLLRNIDPGETEALALLASGKYDEYQFCTGDGLAIVALSVLGLASSQGISLEKLVQDTGRSTRDIPPSFSEAAFRKRVSDGFVQRDLYR